MITKLGVSPLLISDKIAVTTISTHLSFSHEGEIDNIIKCVSFLLIEKVKT
jgi:hypothetical protein